MTKTQEGFGCEYQVHNEMLNEAEKLFKEAELSDSEREKKTKEIAKEIMKASVETSDIELFLRKVVDMGSKYLEVKSFSIFLLDEAREREGGKALRIADGSGESGYKLKEDRVKYYVPVRPPFTKEEREEKNNLKEFTENLEKDRDFKFSWKERKRLIENKMLPMGITACVVHSGDIANCSLRLKDNKVLDEVVCHEEWRGMAEPEIKEVSGSIIEVPLKWGGEVRGLVKIGNHQESLKIENREELKSLFKNMQEIKAMISKGEKIILFNKNHEKLLVDFAGYISQSLETFYASKERYMRIFGSELLKKTELLNAEEIKGGKNKDVAERIKCFVFNTLARDIIGIDKIYGKVVNHIKETSNYALKLSNEYIGIIEDLERFEGLLRMDIRYRDHFIHQFQVFLLGYYMINHNANLQNLLVEYLKEKGCSESNEDLLDQVITCWFLSSMFHDIAYPIEKTNKLLGSYLKAAFLKRDFHYEAREITPEELLKELRLTIPWGNFLGIYDGIFDYYKTILCDLICERIEGDVKQSITKTLIQQIVKNQNHGLFSALILMHCSYENLPPEKKIIVREAALSMALHTPEIYREIFMAKRGLLSPKEFPFGFLLVFCDNAQQWRRPRLSDLLEDIQIELKKLDISDDNISVELEYSKMPHDAIISKINEPGGSWEFSIENIKFSISFNVRDYMGRFAGIGI